MLSLGTRWFLRKWCVETVLIKIGQLKIPIKMLDAFKCSKYNRKNRYRKIHHTFMKICTRRSDTQASIKPFSTHGNAFSGPINRFSSATLVKTVDAFSGVPSNVDTANVSRHMRIGVVAQKYTHNASRYFRLLRYFISVSRRPEKEKYTFVKLLHDECIEEHTFTYSEFYR